MESPKLYSTKEIISDLSSFKLDQEQLNYEFNLPEINRIIPDIKSNSLSKYNHVISTYPKIEHLNDNTYKSFLCDLEFFNFSYVLHESYINYIRYDKIYNIYFNYLCNKLGNDITLFGSIFNNENLEYTAEYYKYSYNNIIPVPIIIDTIKDYKEPTIMFNLIQERKNMNLPYEYLSHPIYIKQLPEYEHDLYYSPEILNSDTRYAIIPVKIEYEKDSHFCVIFVDHESKTVDYYDPNGSNVAIEESEFICSAFIDIFVDYDIEEFWKSTGMQNTEHLSNKYSEDYCVIWGTIMVHLKLLNPTMTFIEIEDKFLKECVEKKLAIYEVMLNYAYYITRIIPNNFNKLLKLEISLSN